MKKNTRSARQVTALALTLAVVAWGLVQAAQSQQKSTRAPAKNSAARPQDPKNSKVDEVHEDDPTGRIAFASDRSGNFEIYVMNPDGGGLVQVTNHPAEDLNPTWSPDGERLAFTSNRDGNTEIYVVDAFGGLPTRLTNNAAEDLDPAWGPAANPKIAFVSHRDGNDEVYTMNADGTGLTNLTNNMADDNGVAWAPSGTLLSFASNRDGDKFEIYRMTSSGGTVTRLTNNGANDVSTTWPSGRITFQTDRDGNDEIYTMNVDGTNQLRITNNPAFDLDPARAPDGAVIAFVSSRDAADNLEIYVTNADGSNVVRLTNDPASDVDPAVQPLPSGAVLGTIQLGAASFSVDEGQGGVDITVTRTGGTGSAVVDFTTVSGTASHRTDFAPIFRTLTFAPGETSKTVRVLIIDDVSIENDETFTVTLGGAVGSTLGTPSTAIVTITDNDSPTTTPTATIFAVTSANNLVRFRSNTPGTIDGSVAITGLQTGETILGIDVRPATRQIYALGNTGRLYTLNPTTGVATFVSTLSTAPSGSSFGVDFNPVPDRLRSTSDADQNLRTNVDTGAVTVDGALAYATGDANAGQNPFVVGSAYSNNFAGATTTTLYGIDANLDILVRQDPPNSGTLNTVGPLGVNTSDAVGFDIANGSGTAFAVLTSLGAGASAGLYTINLTTGAATLVGNVGGTEGIRGITVANSFSNPIDEVPFFVRQQYLDFLNREADPAGLNFWINELNTNISNCPSAPGQARNDCILGARATVSIAFFLSIEFQDTGYLVIRVYQEAFGRLPTLREFLFDVQNLNQGVIIGQPGALDRLAQNRQAFLDNFVNREEFQSRYTGVSNSAFVDALFTNAGVDPNTEATTRDAILAGLNNGTVTRQSALVQVGSTRSVFNALYNRAFVLMQYFGYLRRNPADPPDSDLTGFNFWVTVLNNTSQPSEDVRDPVQALARIRRARIVEAFITSVEYRARFGPP
jgi:dipeptidyl aminopeptidase/acylaminoacyl peptidase